LLLDFSGLVQGRSHPGARGLSPHPEKIPLPPLTKSGHLAFKIVIKKGKILKIKPKMAINQHHSFVAVCFRILK